MGTNIKPLILIVDDTPKNLQLLSNILHDKGYNICISTSGSQALETINMEAPDLILLDIQMPVMDGFETFKALKLNPKAKDIPIIFLTAVVEPEKILQGFELGAVDYITKPFNTLELTARVATHIEIKRSRENLIELNATKEKLFSIISHDLRNSLGSVLSYSDILLENLDQYSVNKIRQFVNDIYQSSKNTFELLENLLDWSRLQTERLTQRIEKHNLKANIDNIYVLYNEMAKKKKITLQNNVHSDVFIYCDIDMTKTVFRNLISNAIKFTNAGGLVSVYCIESDSKMEIQISDTGVGIKAESIPNLFSIVKNSSTPGTDNEKGTGLGLMLCKDLIEKQGGRIWVESELGKGSTFKFTLPLGEMIDGNK
jgi:two-component system, sensor histidine kinase and response regulator